VTSALAVNSVDSNARHISYDNVLYLPRCWI